MRDIEREFLGLAYPRIIYYCLINHKITKFDDVEKIRRIIRENLEEIVDSFRYTVNYCNELKDGIRTEMENGRYENAVILAGTYIEHLLNEYYIQAFDCKYKMAKCDIENAIKSTSVIDKITWLFKLINGKDFDDNLKAWIKQVNSARNKMVHYKPFGKSGDEFINCDFSDQIHVVLNDILHNLDTLSKFIDKSKMDILIGFEDAEEMAKRVFH